MLSAQRGHDVTLYDEGGSLGGLIPLAAMIKGTEVEPLPEITRYFKGQMAKAGVKVKLNTAVTSALVESVKPDAVLISTGGIITQPNIPGIEKKIVVSNEYLHNASKLPLKVFGPAMLNKLTHYYLPLGKRVVILGGLLQGVELAEFLIKRKRKVTVLEESGELGTGMHEVNRKKLLNWLNFRGMVGYTNIKIKEVTDKGVKIIDKDGQEKLIEADTVLAAGIPAVNDALCKSLQGKAKEIYIIGDCKGAKTILNAIREGAEISRTI